MMQALKRVRVLGDGVAQALASEGLTWMGLLMGHIVVMWWVAQRGGAGDLVIFGGAVAVISLIAAPWLSPLGDKFSKQTLRVLAIGTFFVESLAMWLLAWADSYNLAALIVLEGVALAANCVFVPVSLNQLAELIAADKLSRGLAYQKSAQSIGRLAGPGLAGVMLAVAGTAGALLVQTVVLMGATLLACTVPKRPPSGGRSRESTWLGDMKEGFRAAWSVPLERNWTFVAFLSNLFLFPVLNMLVPLKIQSLGLSGSWFGWCEALLSVGMLLSALKGSEWLVARYGRYASRLIAGWVLMVALAGIGLGDSGPALLIFFGLAGFANATLVLVGLTHRTLARPTAVRSRMAATAGMTVDFAYVVSPLIAGMALQSWTVDEVYLAFGIAGAFLALSISWLPGMRQLLSLDHSEAEGWYSRIRPDAFASETVDLPPADQRTGEAV